MQNEIAFLSDYDKIMFDVFMELKIAME